MCTTEEKFKRFMSKIFRELHKMLSHTTVSLCALCLLRVLCVRFLFSTFSELMKESL